MDLWRMTPNPGKPYPANNTNVRTGEIHDLKAQYYKEKATVNYLWREVDAQRRQETLQQSTSEAGVML